MLANQNKIIFLGLFSVAISGGLVGFTLFKTLGKDEFKPLVNTTTLRLERSEQPSQPSVASRDTDGIPPPVVIASIPSNSPSPATIGSIVAGKSSDKIWKSEDRDRILSGVTIVQVTDQEITVLDKSQSYRVKLNSLFELRPTVKLIKIDRVLRELTLEVGSRFIVEYY